MSIDENSTSNFTQVLSNLFGEMLLATEVSDDNNTDIDLSQFITALKEHSYKSTNDGMDFGALVKLVDGWRSKLNLTKHMDTTSCNYCEGGFREFILAYNSVHGYVSLIVCFFGSLANALNVAVLTRRDLAAAPINRLLKWLAVADVFVMMEYVPFAVYRYFVRKLTACAASRTVTDRASGVHRAALLCIDWKMASNRQVVSVDQPNAESILLDWLNDEDCTDDESQSLEPSRAVIPEELLSDSEDDCIPSDHDSDSECSVN
ncbi:unnamed protein product [Parnassius apollo]|uniref:(apollo) hypothetical protein n=2 Tax=Parnassius apollo TaxID=110799 RepID=A0A8S3Y4Y6_PARAO|nr:unnamed protein product [Parnassius apollo]